MKQHPWLISILFLVGCQKETFPDAPIAAAVTIKDVAYGNDPRQKMDVYLPATRSADSTKAIIIIHGGGWQEGDKSDFTPYVALLQQKLPNYAVFNLNYRLAAGSANLFPSQENDIKDAVAFIYSMKNEYSIADKFVYLGASAGGHLALLQGYKNEIPLKAKAVVSFFGPTDLTALYNSSLLAGLILAQVTGGTPASNQAIYQQSSPLQFVNAQSPPTMLLHGGADPLVPSAQAELLQSALNTAGVLNQYVFYPGEGHGWVGSKLADSFDKIALFLETHVN